MLCSWCFFLHKNIVCALTQKIPHEMSETCVFLLLFGGYFAARQLPVLHPTGLLSILKYFCRGYWQNYFFSHTRIFYHSFLLVSSIKMSNLFPNQIVNHTWISVPFPISLMTLSFASCCATMCFTIASPSPVPPVNLERLLSTR